MNAIQWFQERRAALRGAERWRSLIGSRYSGGGGGVGNVCRASVILTIYHQEYDGATNYHDAPKELREAIEEIIKDESTGIVERALDLMRSRVREAAKKATAEATDVLEEASRA